MMIDRRLRLALICGMLLLTAALLPQAPIARAATPGELIADLSYTLGPGASSQPYFYYLEGTTELTNVRIIVSGGATGDTATLVLRNSANTDIGSWIIHSGETTWGTATLPAGGKLVLQNNSGSATLTTAATVYAADIIPSVADSIGTWEGTSVGGGINPTITLSAPEAGLYRFSLGAASGSYQLLADDAGAQPYIQKTVQAGNAPANTDSVYFLPAGLHTFAIEQDPTGGTTTGWSAAIEPVGGSDPLPTSESSAVLGGGSFFNEEWVPLNVQAGADVNISISVNGVVTDSLELQLYNGDSAVYTSTTIFGGEVTWGTSALAAGANALHIVANAGNSSALSYQVTISVVGQTPFTWAGTTAGTTARSGSGHSQIRLTFPTNGLYDFTLGATSGRFQFLLGDNYFQKTITDTTTVSAYVLAGTYDLEVAQDPTATATTWSAQVQPGTALIDSLPFARSGGGLETASSTTFSEEWLPLAVPEGLPVNIQVIAHGVVSDSLRLELYNGDSLGYTASTIFGGETFWATTSLGTHLNRLHIVATGGQLSYEVLVTPVPVIPTTGTTSWSGLSRPNGLQPTVRLNAPVDGIYNVVLEVFQGGARAIITPSPLGRSENASTITLRVPLTSGLNTFVVEQDSTLASVTDWRVTVSLQRTTAALAVTAATPGSFQAGQSVDVILTGSSFQADTEVELVPASGPAVPILGTVFVSGTSLQITVPASVAAGSYGVRVINPGNVVAETPGLLTIGASPITPTRTATVGPSPTAGPSPTPNPARPRAYLPIIVK